MPGKDNLFYFPLFREPQDTIPQDTTRIDTSIQQQETPDTSKLPEEDSIDLGQSPQPEFNKLDSLTRVKEAKSQKTQEVEVQKPQYTPSQVQQPTPKPGADTTSIIYEITGATELPIYPRLTEDSAYINFLYNLPASKPDSSKIEIYQSDRQQIQTHTEKPAKPKLPEANIPKNQHFDWTSYLIIGLFIVLGWTRLFFKRYFNTLFKSFHFINYAQELYQEKSSLTIRGATFLNGIYFFVAGLFSYQLTQYFIPQLQLVGYKIFLILTAFFIIWYTWNAIFKHFTGSVFQKINVFSEYFYNYNIYRKILGITLFPVVIINQYIDESYTLYFIYAGIIIFAVIYLMHILRGLQIFIKNNVSIFYLILYLCALEFLPLLVLYKWITNEL